MTKLQDLPFEFNNPWTWFFDGASQLLFLDDPQEIIDIVFFSNTSYKIDMPLIPFRVKPLWNDADE